MPSHTERVYCNCAICTGQLETAEPRDMYEAQLKHANEPAPQTQNGAKLRLSDLFQAPKAFQPRVYEPSKEHTKEHIETLAAVLKNQGTLDAIKVYAIGSRLFVIDGHCRLAAYAKANRRTIPATLFTGSFGEALSESRRANSKDKLRVSKTAKIESAWDTVKFQWSFAEMKQTTRQVAQDHGISKSTVAIMVRTLDDAKPQMRAACLKLPWCRVGTLQHDEQNNRTFDEEWRQQLRADWVRRLRKTFAFAPQKQPEIFAEAVQEAFGSNVWRSVVEIVKEDEGLE